MMPDARAAASPATPHIPVLLRPLLAGVAPVSGTWVDGTFGAGGYARGLLAAGAERVIGIDRDPSVFDLAAPWAEDYGERLRLARGTFSELDKIAGGPVEGVVLDLGVSSMQLDQPERGFSFLRDGPLDMRMGDSGPTAADLVNGASEEELADILFHYGEERQARRIARAICRARAEAPLVTTGALAALIERQLPRPKPGQSHPATRSFQALRIAVNDEFGQLAAGLEAATRALAPGGRLAVVSFHSLEDRVVKRFLHLAASEGGGGSRHAPAQAPVAPLFRLTPKKAIAPDAEELEANPRARSARLRIATRTDAPARPIPRDRLGLPAPVLKG
ncbi:MAG: 16S rRNA (cytosine(1402)-N(4))-methyltransferase RsmH [Alphaproteobacteria bacterium]|nr:MAG: 16S rRNA (cytosine(1402)-N(4))-methyltransferase RsmH [Alphaproteobacteria bacterium]